MIDDEDQKESSQYSPFVAAAEMEMMTSMQKLKWKKKHLNYKAENNLRTPKKYEKVKKMEKNGKTKHSTSIVANPSSISVLIVWKCEKKIKNSVLFVVKENGKNKRKRHNRLFHT